MQVPEVIPTKKNPTELLAAPAVMVTPVVLAPAVTYAMESEVVAALGSNLNMELAGMDELPVGVRVVEVVP